MNYKKTIIFLLTISIIATSVPMVSQAAVTPAFTAVNDTVLPFNENTMPLFVGDEIFVPPAMFSTFGIFEFSDVGSEIVRVYRGDRGVDFWIAYGRVEDISGNALNWPNARLVGNRFYVPLAQLASFFGLTWEVIQIREDIIPGGQMRMVRLRDGRAVFNGPTLVGYNATLIRNMYNAFFRPQPPPGPGGNFTGEQPSPPEEEPPPTFEEVTIYLSFIDLKNGDLERVLDIFDADVLPNYRAAFFVTGHDIIQNPDLIRRIHGSGHTIGIWLEYGSLDEYIKTSALLFEAAKVRTILVSALEANTTARLMADRAELIFWDATFCFVPIPERPEIEETPETAEISEILEISESLEIPEISEEEIISTLPTEDGVRAKYRFAFCGQLDSVLPSVLAVLDMYEYSVERITETTPPIRIYAQRNE